MTADSWTHAICDADYLRLAPLKGWPQIATSPTRAAPPIMESCCYCSEPTSGGLYVQDDPALVHAVVP